MAVCLALCAPLGAWVRPAEAQPIDSLRDVVATAIAHADWPRLELAIARLRLEAREAPDHLAVQYDLGYALHRRASALLRAGRDVEARRMLEEADRALTRAVSLGGGGGAVALRAIVMRERARVVGTLDAMRLEPRVYRQLDTALALAPDDPRVALLNGMARLDAPRTFDGGAANAEREFRRAIELFEADSSASPAPTWGRDDVWIWLGIALAQQDKREEARIAFEKALELSPGHAWVTSTLLPETSKRPRR